MEKKSPAPLNTSQKIASFAYMSKNQTVFHFEEGKDNFENYSQENGITFWWASDYMKFLDYESQSSFDNALNKAMTTCNTLKIPIVGNFDQVVREVDGKTIHDFKLSRVACFLISMNGDTKKEEVAKAQMYFATLAGAVQNYLEEAQGIERVLMRDEISERESSLSGVAYSANVENYGFFQNAGYRGMYNKHISQLKVLRRIDKGSLLDFMGKDELAANLFRITQTELKIKNEKVMGQSALEATAHSVGKQVRDTMIKISGIRPEDLPPAENIGTVKKRLKEKSKELKKIDSRKDRKHLPGNGESEA